MDIDDFAASEGWFWRFKMHHGLTFKNACGEKADADQATCDEWVPGQLREHLAGYALSEVFNADKTAVYFKLLPNKTIMFKNSTCVGVKEAKSV